VAAIAAVLFRWRPVGDSGGVGTRVSSPVLVGRQREREQLRRTLGRAAAGETLLITVGGDPGVGKTRLVQDMAGAAAGLGFRVLIGACLDIGDGTLPFGPVVEALRPLAAETEEEQRAGALPVDPALSALFPGLGPVPGGSGAAGEGRVFELLREILDRLAARQPVLLVVEDAHWADTSTRRVLLYLIRNLGPRVCLVVTYRLEELHERYPLRLLLSELHRSSRCERIILDPLTRAELGELIAAILGRLPAPAMVTEIMRRAEGNPFYAEELLAVPERAAGLPGGLRSVLLARVEQLPREARPVLGAVAAGTRVSHDLLAAVTGLGEGHLGELLLAAVQRHVLIADADGGSYGFRHALVREAVYGDMLPGERRQMHARIATVLAGRARTAPAAPAADLGELAYHWYRAGDRPRALLASVRAGMAAQATAAPGSAEQHYERALKLWDEAPEAAANSPLDHAGLLRRAAETAHLTGDYARGAALAGEALADVDAEAEPGRASTLLEFLGYCRIAGSDNDAAAAAYSAAAACAAPASPERARALAGMSLVQCMQGRYRDAISTGEEGRQIALRVAAGATEARALTVLGSSLCGLGRLAEGLAHLGRAQRLAGEEHDIATLLWTSGQRAAGLLAAGRAAEAAGTAAEIMRLARGIGAEAAYAPYSATPGIEAMILLGDWPAAGRLTGRLLSLEPPGGAAAFTRLACGLLRLWQGDAEPARTVITRALQDSRPAMVPEAASAGYARLAEVATAQRRFGEARQLVRTGLAECAGSDGPAHVIRLAAAGVHAEAERGQAAASRRRREELSSAVTTAGELIDLARRAAAGMGGELAVASAELAEAEADWAGLARREEQDEASRWRESVRRWDALGFRYPAAHARLRLGHALLAASGSSAEAAGELRAALGPADALGARALARQIRRLAARARVTVEPEPAAEPAPGPPGPLGAVPPGPSSGLTGRERQVLELLATGLTNKNIARTLFISEKTVSVHVTHILAKLQVTNRSEAGAIARDGEKAAAGDGGQAAPAALPRARQGS
jgi:DNA-binding CsgD family transcriptional regulator/tetratricopeptide (TPR) repeat protein